MTIREEKRLAEALNGLYDLAEENNMMLHQICDVVNMYLARHHQENEDDFGRNVLANLISNVLDLGKMRRK